ncbi:laminin subunit alpha-1-like [Dysidea avara]|uniref:laminin subunit alpha-1-like n=1 Tax=Dysidea avara TaxID=196820 RepID=UPI003316DAFA
MTVLAIEAFVCVLALISVARAAELLERSPSVPAELIHSLGWNTDQSMAQCMPPLYEQAVNYYEKQSRTLLLCLQSNESTEDDNNSNQGNVELIALVLEISGANGRVRVIAESVTRNGTSDNNSLSPYNSAIVFDNLWRDSTNYLRWKKFLINRLGIPHSYFVSKVTLSKFYKRDTTSTKGTTDLLLAIAQNIDRGMVKANSIKAKVYEAIRMTGIAKKRVKKISSSIDTSNTAKSIVELQERSQRVEKLLTEINEDISTLQNEKQYLEYDIDNLHVQLNAAKISQEYRDRGPQHQLSLQGDGYAMLQAPSYNQSFSYSFVFRTSSANALLLFNTNVSMGYWYSFLVVKGALVFRYKSEDGVTELASQAKLNDGEWHKIDLVKTTASLQLYVDQGFAAYSSIRSQFLSSTVWGPLFVGGIPERLSPLLKGVTDTSFTGCLKELKIQQKLYDFRDSIGLKSTSFNCSVTQEIPAKPYYFDGNGYATYRLPPGKVGSNFSIQIQLKTNNKEGVLFSVFSSEGTDALSMEMKHGKLFYHLDNGEGGFLIQYQGKRLSDNRWHTVLAQKKGNFISLTVDNQPPQKARFAGTDQNADTNSLFYIGGLPPGTPLPDGITTFTRFSGCMLLNELQDRNCQHVRLQECNS